MRVSAIIAFSLVVIGSLVWFIVGVFNFNLVAYLFGAGAGAWISRTIYTLVGISALWLIIYFIAYKPFSRTMG